LERDLLAWADAGAVIGEPDGVRAVEIVADAFHRRGVPATNGRIEGDAIVFDVVAPRGVG